MAKILVIDDDESVLELLKLRLTKLGHLVVSAADGMSGPMIASREKPDLIILDFNMPAGNGATVHQRLRGISFTADKPVIFLTAERLRGLIPQITDDPKTRFLEKPINFELLYRTIDDFLGAPQPAQKTAPPAVYDPDNPQSTSGDDVLDLD